MIHDVFRIGIGYSLGLFELVFEVSKESFMDSFFFINDLPLIIRDGGNIFVLLSFGEFLMENFSVSLTLFEPMNLGSLSPPNFLFLEIIFNPLLNVMDVVFVDVVYVVAFGFLQILQQHTNILFKISIVSFSLLP